MAHQLTARDRALLRDLWLYRYLSTQQLARLHFRRHAKLAQRRLRVLTTRGVVDRFQPGSAPQIGFGTWWYRLARAGAHVVAASEDRPVDRIVPPKRPPRSLTSLAHHALTTDVRIWLREGTARIGLAYQFIPSYEEVREHGRRQRRIALSIPGHTRLLIADGAFTLGSEDQHALFLLEVDRGTEPLTGRHPSAIERKLTMYRAAFDARAETHYAQLFQASVTGFRVLCVVPDEQRQHQFVRLAKQLDLTPLVWVAINTTVRQPGDLSHACWAVSPHGSLHALTD